MGIYSEEMLRKAIFAFLLVLDSMIVADILFRYMSRTPGDKLRAAAYHQITEPIYRPFRFVVKYSMYSQLKHDISPFISLTLFIYAQNLLV